VEDGGGLEGWQDDKERGSIVAKMRKLLVRLPKVTVCKVFEWKEET
jgi:hypothetical protein